MKQNKSFYQSLPTYNGFKWVGFWDGLHHFTKRFELGWLEIMANDEDIETNNIEDMARFSVSR